MHCIKCGKPLAPGATFCAHCGAKQTGAATATKSGGTPWVAIASMVAGLGVLGGVGVWGWNNYSAKEAQQKGAAQPSSLVSVAAPAPAQLSPDEARERAEIVAAQAALAKHIIEEENLAKSRAGVK
jgi:cytoskeletal protein RodZ